MTLSDNMQALNTTPHNPVMLSEMLEYLQTKDGKNYLDCTFGAGGYSNAILESADCCVTALDKDPAVSLYVDKLQSKFLERFEFIQTNFADGKAKLKGKKFDGIILDLGVSSMQIDSADRGFSFMKDGPLDMRMGQVDLSAAEFIASSSEEEIANVIYKYGEEVQSRQIAKAITEARNISPITRTLELANIVRNAMHFRKSKIDPVTKIFQAIRIYINKELESLEKFLNDVKDMLVPKGRILVVSFHSLEDSIVKHFFKQHSPLKVARSKYSTEPRNFKEKEWLKIITKKPITPSRSEVNRNPRSRSARLRVAEKRARDNVS